MTAGIELFLGLCKVGPEWRLVNVTVVDHRDDREDVDLRCPVMDL